jgi:hypothetical protein
MQLQGQETLTLPAEKGPSILLVLEGGAQIDYDVVEEVSDVGVCVRTVAHDVCVRRERNPNKP